MTHTLNLHSAHIISKHNLYHSSNHTTRNIYKCHTRWNDILYLGKGRPFSLGQYKESHYQERPWFSKTEKPYELNLKKL